MYSVCAVISVFFLSRPESLPEILGLLRVSAARSFLYRLTHRISALPCRAAMPSFYSAGADVPEAAADIFLGAESDRGRSGMPRVRAAGICVMR